MDLQELATNARLNHWPPHLGVKTDAEKIEYLAQRLQEAGDAETRAAELADENGALREERDDYERKADDLQGKLDRIRAIVGPSTE